MELTRIGERYIRSGLGSVIHAKCGRAKLNPTFTAAADLHVGGEGTDRRGVPFGCRRDRRSVVAGRP